MKTNHFRVMKMAHILYRSKLAGRQLATNTDHQPVLNDWSNSVKTAWYFEHFRQWLAQGLVTFTYLKLDNSIRDARGTLNEFLIPRDDHPKGTKSTAVNYAIINYFDIDRKAWRSFDIRLFIGYVERFPLQKHPEI